MLRDFPKHSHDEMLPQPNTALLSLILTLGTFLIAYFLRIFRNSKFLGRSVSINHPGFLTVQYGCHSVNVCGLRGVEAIMTLTTVIRVLTEHCTSCCFRIQRLEKEWSCWKGCVDYIRDKDMEVFSDKIVTDQGQCVLVINLQAVVGDHADGGKGTLLVFWKQGISIFVIGPVYESITFQLFRFFFVVFFLIQYKEAWHFSLFLFCTGSV